MSGIAVELLLQVGCAADGAARIQPPLADPARLPFPVPGEPVAVCPGGRNALQRVGAVLNPGTYDGLDISAGSAVRLLPGTYLFTDDLVVGDARLVGENVLLAFSRARFWMKRRARVRLSAPRTGTHAGVLLVEDPRHRSGDSWISVGCEATLDYDGMMLFPSSSIWVFDGAVVRGTEAFGAESVWLQSGCDVAVRRARSARSNAKAPIALH